MRHPAAGYQPVAAREASGVNLCVHGWSAVIGPLILILWNIAVCPVDEGWQHEVEESPGRFEVGLPDFIRGLVAR